jgi:excisionase family DNA binding protein
MDEKTEILTAEKLARRLEVTPDTIRGWARAGKIPTIRLSRKVIRFDLHAVMAALGTSSSKEVRHD